jgi:aryl-alcohol dehydrogenase-like predicted oxidoreductase
MRYKLLGKSGLRVSELCLGTMTFGEEWGWGADRKESHKMYDVYREAGGNFIDTANRYTEGTSEKFVGEFIADCREEIVLATKYTLFMKHGDPNSAGNHRKNMVQALENSLRRLKTEYIDLYWVHAWDGMTPVEEIMRGLDDLVRAGKILYIGISDTPAWVVSQANTLASLRGWTQFVALQIEHSLIQRTVERELLPMAKAFDMAVTPWGAIGGGILTGKYSKRDKQESSTHRYQGSDSMGRLNDLHLEIADEVVKLAKQIDCSPAQVAINWALQHHEQSIPIVGARTVEQLKDNLDSMNHSLSSDQQEHLNTISQIEKGFPHDFLEKDFIRDLVYGGTFENIDNHRK